MQSTNSVSRPEAVSALESYLGYCLSEGLDELYDDAPVDRTREPVHLAAPNVYVNVNVKSSRVEPQFDLEAAVAEARQAAKACDSLESLYDAIARCQAFADKRDPASPVIKGRGFSETCEKAPILIIGESPGRAEHVSGQAFCGPHGRLLDKILAAGHLQDQTYISHAKFFASHSDSGLTAQDLALSAPFLSRMAELLESRLILFAGAQILRQACGVSGPPNAWRGRDLTPLPQLWGDDTDLKNKARFRAILAPSLLLTQPLAKALVWQDIIRIKHDFDL